MHFGILLGLGLALWSAFAHADGGKAAVQSIASEKTAVTSRYR